MRDGPLSIGACTCIRLYASQNAASCHVGRVVPVLGLLPPVTPLTPRVFLSVGNEHGALPGQSTAQRVTVQVIEHVPIVGAVVLIER